MTTLAEFMAEQREKAMAKFIAAIEDNTFTVETGFFAIPTGNASYRVGIWLEFMSEGLYNNWGYDPKDDQAVVCNIRINNGYPLPTDEWMLFMGAN